MTCTRCAPCTQWVVEVLRTGTGRGTGGLRVRASGLLVNQSKTRQKLRSGRCVRWSDHRSLYIFQYTLRLKSVFGVESPSEILAACDRQRNMFFLYQYQCCCLIHTHTIHPSNHHWSHQCYQHHRCYNHRGSQSHQSHWHHGNHRCLRHHCKHSSHVTCVLV